MRTVQSGPVVSFMAVVAVLSALTLSVGLGGAGWLAGLACASLISLLLARALANAQLAELGAANQVTLIRAVLACVVAALVAQSFVSPTPVRTLVTLSAVALVLDAVDGFVARRTGTTSALGARLDMEVDAFLILVLSVYVAQSAGWWVLAMGLARYAFWTARLMVPRLRGTAPARPWCKVVAAIQGIVLAVAAADVLPVGTDRTVLAVALVMLAESFGREAWELWRMGADTHVRPVALLDAMAARDG